MAEEIHYEDMLVYVARIREATTPLGILVNADFLTDILDREKNELEVFKKYGIKTQMERDQLRNRLRADKNNFQMYRLHGILRASNSHNKSEVCRQ